MRLSLPALLFVMLIASIKSLVAQPLIERIGEPLSHPWGMDFLSDSHMLVTTREGDLYQMSLATGDTNQIAGVPEVAHWGQGGLLDIAVAGEDIFLCYAKLLPEGASTAIDKARLSDNKLVGRMTIFVSNKPNQQAHHFGCRLAIDGQHIYATIGDRGMRYDAQNPTNHNGSVVRLTNKGKAGDDNPKNAGWLEELFTIGHRNPQGLAIHPETNALWLHEHGPQGGDEINILKAGKNYGWPVVSFGKEYGTDTPVSPFTTHPDMADPIWVWVPSIAPSGMAFYPKDAPMFPKLQGQLLIGSLKFKSLYQVKLGQKGLPVFEQRLLEGTLGRIRDVAVSPQGAIYILNDANDRTKPTGGLYRLSQ